MKYIQPLVFALLLSACSVKYDTYALIATQNKQIYNLQKAIENLSNSVNKEEAQKVAELSFVYSLELANKYELVSPPSFHNSLINMNLKERGLCYHFARDLVNELNKLDLETLELRRGVHNNKKFFEHSSVVVTSKNGAFEKGIVLDAWRDSGRLYWNYLKDDTQYDWKEYITVPLKEYFFITGP
jgi:hypothetical protein